MKHTTTTLASALPLLLSLAQPVLARPDDVVRNDESQRTAQQEPKVKPGSKDDIDAIGNRDIGGGRGDDESESFHESYFTFPLTSVTSRFQRKRRKRCLTVSF
jgi:hypothetical protein